MVVRWICGQDARLRMRFVLTVGWMVLLLLPLRSWGVEWREVPSSVSPRIAASTSLGDADPNESLPMSLTLQVQHRDELDTLIAEQQRRGSGVYRQWLTPDEFAARYGAPDDAYTALADWLHAQGFAVRTWPNRLRIDFTGTVSRTESAFRVRMRQYEHRGRRHLANATAPQLPAQFADLVRSARLNTFPLADPLLRLSGPQGVTNTMAPNDIYTAYDMAAVLARGINGEGQTIAVVARSDFLLSDVTTFETQFGVPIRDPMKVFPGGNPGVGSPNGACQGIRNPQLLQNCLLGEEGEVVLDTEWALAMAPGATVLVDISDMDVDVSLAHVLAHHPEAKIVSVSFGLCELMDASVLSTFEPMYLQAVAQGQTILIATGDNGADECGNGAGASVNVLGSDPHVTTVGGTALNPGFDANGNATGYVQEIAWNDQDGASGGGVSRLVQKPAYQSGPGVPADGFRDQPDVAFIASPPSPGCVIILEGFPAIIGGTSLAAPAWAGIVAVLNDAVRANGLGELNDTLYALGREQFAHGGPAVFHDITIGNNTVGRVHGFSAGPGYDLVTGWGSPDVKTLATALRASQCGGDCNGDGVVTVNEIQMGIRMALAEIPMSRCQSMDTNLDGQVSIDELLRAVNQLLSGC